MIVAIFALQLGDSSHLADIATQIASAAHRFLLVLREIRRGPAAASLYSLGYYERNCECLQRIVYGLTTTITENPLICTSP
jgi:hypothetical protein